MKKLFLLIAAVALVSGLGLRHQNSQTLHSLAEAVVAADAAGQDVAAPLARVQKFASDHMSAPLRIVLQASHRRATELAQTSAQPGVTNAKVYAEAQAACAGRGDSVTQARCNQDYVSKHLAPATIPTPVVAPKLSDYTHEIRSPLWTPDLAGMTVGVAAVVLVAGIVMPGRRRRK